MLMRVLFYAVSFAIILSFQIVMGETSPHGFKLRSLFEKQSCEKVLISTYKNSKAIPRVTSCYDSIGLRARLFADDVGYSELYLKKGERLEFFRLDPSGRITLFKWGGLNSKKDTWEFTYFDGIKERFPRHPEANFCPKSQPTRQILDFSKLNLDEFLNSRLILEVDKSCDGFQGVVDAGAQLQKIARESIKKGMDCLSHLKGARVEQDLAQMDELFFNAKRPIQIRCEDMPALRLAQATFCYDERWPTIWIGKMPLAEHTFFHEFYHIIDPRNLHFERKELLDRTISCEFSCFGVAGYIVGGDKSFHTEVCQNPEKVNEQKYVEEMLKNVGHAEMEKFLFQIVNDSGGNNGAYSKIIVQRFPYWRIYPWSESKLKELEKSENVYFAEKEKKYRDRIANFKSDVARNQADMRKYRDPKIIAILENNIRVNKDDIRLNEGRIRLLDHCAKLRERFPEFFLSPTRRAQSSMKSNEAAYNSFSKEYELPSSDQWELCI